LRISHVNIIPLEWPPHRETVRLARKYSLTGETLALPTAKDEEIPARRRQASLCSEDVIKLPKSDFFVPKLPVFSITFGRKTKKSQPLRMTVKKEHR
jgi:hypothetical protein